jgi:hypothetical protein
MNVFDVLRVNFEVFHTRMLGWLASPTGEHGHSEQVLGILFDAAGLERSKEAAIAEEVKIDVPNMNRYRLADLVIRTRDGFLLIENKVDAFYQDVEQLRDEAAGGKEIAQRESRKFALLLIAPGPLSPTTESELDSVGGRFLSWSDLVLLLRGLPAPSDPHAAEILRQYFEFVEKRCAPVPVHEVRPRPAEGDRTLANADAALLALLASLAAGTETNASVLWPKFVSQYPDHARALDDRYAGSRYFNSKSWFGLRLQQLAAKRSQLEDTGIWEASSPVWGFETVRRYRRIQGPTA